MKKEGEGERLTQKWNQSNWVRRHWEIESFWRERESQRQTRKGRGGRVGNRNQW
jgi:hypothetical protein